MTNRLDGDTLKTLQGPADEIRAALVRAELNRIVSSGLFTRSARLSAFLRFIVDSTLAGHGDSLKEHVIAVELYGKPGDFEAAADPIVRIDARRLRDKLREYYAEAPASGVVISVPKGTYTPVFRVAAADATQPTSSVSTGRDSRRWLIAAAALLSVAVAVTWAVRTQTRDAPESLRLMTVTSLPGSEEDPSFSPDGRFVAFTWSGPPPAANRDAIWIKSVDSEATHSRINTPDLWEKWPQWSPDGQWIAFSRRLEDQWVVVKVSPLGGPEQTIADSAGDAAWTPDGRGLVMRSFGADDQSAIVHQDLDKGVRRPLTHPPAGFIDMRPRVSPDGKTLAFVRFGGGRRAVFLAPMSGGEPSLFGEWSVISGIGGLEWTPDGREIFVAREVAGGRRVMRRSVGTRGPEIPLPGMPSDVAGLSVSRIGAT